MKNTTRNYRSQRGFIGSVILLFGIFVILLFACMSVDIAHFVSADTEMQTAVDAAAMAGCFDMSWDTTAALQATATSDAQFMLSHCPADIYNQVPTSPTIQFGYYDQNYAFTAGSTPCNAIKVSMACPTFFLFAPFIIGNGTANNVGVSAIAMRLPLYIVDTPPWGMYVPGGQSPNGTCPGLMNSPAAPSSGFPKTAYFVFNQYQGSCPSLNPPVQGANNYSDATPGGGPFYIDMAVSSLFNGPSNPKGIANVLTCNGTCSSVCQYPNPSINGVTSLQANHGSYNSAISNPQGQIAYWTSGKTQLMPLADTGNSNKILGFYAVKMIGSNVTQNTNGGTFTGGYVANSFQHGQGIFGEFGMEFVASPNNLPAVLQSPSSVAPGSTPSVTLPALIQ